MVMKTDKASVTIVYQPIVNSYLVVAQVLVDKLFTEVKPNTSSRLG